MRETMDIFAAPTEALSSINHDPQWRTPLTVWVGIFFLLAWLTGCWQNLSEAFSWSNLLVPALFSPLIVGVVSTGTALLIYLLNLILGDQQQRATSFKKLFSVNIHCAVIILLGEVVNFTPNPA